MEQDNILIARDRDAVFEWLHNSSAPSTLNPEILNPKTKTIDPKP